MNWCRIILGFIVSVAGGGFVLWLLIPKCLGPYAGRQHKYDYQEKKAHLTWLVGIVERFFYTGVLFVAGLQGGGGWAAIGGWLAIKVAARWQRPDNQYLRDSDNIWLIGTGLSVFFGYVGASIALGHLPLLEKQSLAK